MSRPAPPALVPLLLGLLAGLGAAQAPAGGSAAHPASAAPVRARLLAETGQLVAGQVNQLGVLLELGEGWHVYAPCLNDSGMPVGIEPTLPAGWQARPAEWPAPVRLVTAGELLDHVYAERVLLPLPVDVPADAAGQDVTLRAHVTWMVCREVCQLGEADISLPIKVLAPGASATPSTESATFREAHARTPRPLPAEGAPLRAAWQADGVLLTAPGASALAFYPDADAPPLADLLHEGAAEGERLLIRLREGEAPGAPLRGVAEVTWPGDRPHELYRLEVSVAPVQGRAERAPQPEESDHVR